MNMSNSVIDTGAAVDTMARFLHAHRESFSAQEYKEYSQALREVVETYLADATRDKPITNQRLWSLTGLASWARLAGEEEKYREVAKASIEKAFSDMTPDGFFRYYPEAQAHGAPASYDGMTTFYQSRCAAFIRYSLEMFGISAEPFEKQLRKSEEALLAMYTADGVKDLRLECKRWYWLSPYEVASHGFDAYALAHSSIPEARTALHNTLFQARRHFWGGYLHSHRGAPVNFQCPIFWTAHLAWLTRIPNIKELFDAADILAPFRYQFVGKEIIAITSQHGRVLLNANLGPRNPTTGIFQNGLSDKAYWRLQMPALPHRFLFSARETLNHSWYALRGGYVREALLRLVLFARECALMLLPRYSTAYGKIVSSSVQQRGDKLAIEAAVIPASKYGTVAQGVPAPVHIEI